MQFLQKCRILQHLEPVRRSFTPAYGISGIIQPKKPENTVRFRVFRLGWIFLFFRGYFPAMESVSTRTLGDPKVVEPRGMGSVRLEATAVILVRRS